MVGVKYWIVCEPVAKTSINGQPDKGDEGEYLHITTNIHVLQSVTVMVNACFGVARPPAACVLTRPS